MLKKKKGAGQHSGAPQWLHKAVCPLHRHGAVIYLTCACGTMEMIISNVNGFEICKGRKRNSSAFQASGSFVAVAWVWSLLWLSVMTQATKRWSKIRVGPFTCRTFPLRKKPRQIPFFKSLHLCNWAYHFIVLSIALPTSASTEVMFCKGCTCVSNTSREYSIYKQWCK